MSEQYLSEIRMVAFNFPPKGWAFCNGQILSIQQNQALFSILGTTYGGNGQTTFALPNLQGRVPLHFGSSPQGGSYTLGQIAGEPAVTLISSQMPAHTHQVKANSGANTNAASNTAVPGGGGAPGYGSATDTAMNPQIVGMTGGSQPHNNMQPYLVINFCIALVGIFPSRN